MVSPSTTTHIDYLIPPPEPPGLYRGPSVPVRSSLPCPLAGIPAKVREETACIRSRASHECTEQKGCTMACFQRCRVLDVLQTYTGERGPVSNEAWPTTPELASASRAPCAADVHSSTDEAVLRQLPSSASGRALVTS
eukprot:scaffold2330_cov376-Prasinococcus_capsulatus_cf.AAC.3